MLLDQSQREVRRELSESEGAQFRAGKPQIHHMTPVTFMTTGLKLEETQ